MLCAQDIYRVAYFYTSIVSKCKVPMVSAVGKSTSKHT